MKRSVATGVIVLVAVAFVVAALTGGQGWPFVASLVVAAAVMIGFVFYVAFSGGGGPRPRRTGRDFLAFEEATRYLEAPGLSDGARSAHRPAGDPATIEAMVVSARAFVRTLVPEPVPPPDLSVAPDRREYLDALRKEGTGLIRLAKVTGVDVAPYQAFLSDTREEAVLGEWSATLRSLQLANELLRATIVKFLVKRKRAGEEVRGLEEL